MQRGHFEETRATARLPNLDIEIIHSRSAEGDAERLSISLQAIPSFEAFGRYLEFRESVSVLDARGPNGLGTLARLRPRQSASRERQLPSGNAKNHRPKCNAG